MKSEAVAKDGVPYDNMYSWFMKMKNGKIVEEVAILKGGFYPLYS
ncbi:MAG TPA: hypothetical protein VK616_07785 [Flavitalea sp.]|nr:hypothetical protein [Flavitalea sp.]